MNGTGISIGHIRIVAAIFCAVLGLIASANLLQAVAADAAPASMALIQSALESPDRFAGDSDEDARRKSPDVLAFMGARPGMQVLDYFAGGGYNSELLSRIAGHNGSVIAYNSPAHVKRSGEKLAQRFGGNRLANVIQIISSPNELQLHASSLNAVLFVMAYHDLYHSPRDAATPAANIEKITASIFQAMKPGGIVVIADHIANAASNPVEAVDALHRIDPEVVKNDFTKAGFKFDGESMILRNAADDHSKPVFDPSVRHKTDQFLFRFKKAE